MTKLRQRGLTTVEFAIVATLLFIIIFTVIEFGRTWYISNALVEATRRGARVAAVCPVGDSKPAEVALLLNDGGVSAISPDLTTSNIVVSYLDMNGAPIANPTSNYSAIRYVQVQVVNFTHQLLIPFIAPSVTMPAYTAVLPIESLGYAPSLEAFQSC
jgi:Flp pilus assembly protein TadG